MYLKKYNTNYVTIYFYFVKRIFIKLITKVYTKCNQTPHFHNIRLQISYFIYNYFYILIPYTIIKNIMYIYIMYIIKTYTTALVIVCPMVFLFKCTFNNCVCG